MKKLFMAFGGFAKLFFATPCKKKKRSMRNAF